MELPQVPPPEPPAPRCIHLYGGSMAIHGEGFEASDDYVAGMSTFTCNQTGRPLGPDGAAVGMRRCCAPDRSCYEEY
jgi:hypothetical protein